jgi:hypothetical protein
MSVIQNYMIPIIQSSLNDSNLHLFSLKFHPSSTTSLYLFLLAAYNVGFGAEFTPS